MQRKQAVLIFVRRPLRLRENELNGKAAYHAEEQLYARLFVTQAIEGISMRLVPGLLAAALLISTAPSFAQSSAGQATSLTGKIVDLATYVTHDHNMDAMKGDAMKGDAMKGDAMKGDAMKGDAMKGDAMKGSSSMVKTCPSMIGVVTSGGRAYPLAFQQGSATSASACSLVGSNASLDGSIYSQAGVTLFLVNAIR